MLSMIWTMFEENLLIGFVSHEDKMASKKPNSFEKLKLHNKHNFLPNTALCLVKVRQMLQRFVKISRGGRRG